MLQIDQSVEIAAGHLGFPDHEIVAGHLGFPDLEIVAGHLGFPDLEMVAGHLGFPDLAEGQAAVWYRAEMVHYLTGIGVIQ